ncbi:hypothetical protein K435DRAFT_213317 [Dendrothele bispora CBS 962.96]|uniref:Uncharacterized protein n=1 Tax=Dendrothele bispora (strain CBS 962.96) TaxID=1314807 RepID=A0A4S8LT96_DENBC|nr:hypothetical protein K435DRAFT_213317 [Dendrothele bispora CBS 962.96]
MHPTYTPQNPKPSQYELTAMLGVLDILQNDPTLDFGPDYSQSNLQYIPYIGFGPTLNEDKWLRTLDTIASCLSTGNLGEQYAVSVKTNQRVSFLIAKTGKITAADDRAVQDFTFLVTNHISREKTSAVYVKDYIFPFLIRRCRRAMSYNIGHLLSSILSYNWDMALRRFSWERGIRHWTMEDFFPGSEEYRRRMRKRGRTVSVKEMVFMLVEDIIDVCRSPDLEFGSRDEEDVDRQTAEWQVGQAANAKDAHRIQVFHNLAHYCKVLRNSRFMGFLTSDDSIFLDPRMRVEAIRLQRRLKKICQYVYGVRKLVNNARRFSSRGTVLYEWIGEVEDDRTLKTKVSELGSGLSASSIHSLIDRALEQERHSPIQTSRILTRYPLLSDPSSYTPTPQIHPELKILLHFVLNGFSEFTDPYVSIPIGTDEPVCWCCAEWINTWMRSHNGQLSFVLNHLESKLSKDWAAPMSYGDKDIDNINWTVGRRVEKRFSAMIKNASKVSSSFDVRTTSWDVPESYIDPRLTCPSSPRSCPRPVSLSNFHFEMDSISSTPEIRLNGIPVKGDYMACPESFIRSDVGRDDDYLEFDEVPMEVEDEDPFFQGVVQMKGILQVIDDGSGKETKVNDFGSRVTYLCMSS